MRLPESKQGKRLTLAAVVLGVIGIWVLFNRVVPHDDLQGVLDDVSQALGKWTYLLVGALAFLETGAFVGLVVPGETVMLLGGAVAGQGEIDIFLLVGIAWFSAWAGDTTSFLVGRRLGRDFVLRNGPRVGISQERFHKVEDYFGRHGGKTILIGRFIGLVRALAPFVAGSSGMAYRGFVPYSILGTGLWASAFILLGYFFSRSIDTAAEYAGRGAFVLATLIAVVVGSVLAVRFLREPANRRRAVAWMEEHAATRWLLAIGRRLAPPARFLWGRLTPGGTFGLEFTSLMAAAAIALFVLVSYTVVVSGDPGPTGGDMTASDVVGHIRADWLVDVAKAITQLGSSGVVFPLALLAAGALASARRWAELGVLVVGTAIIFFGVHDFKAALDRPRPAGGLVDSSGSSFPSGHAAYSVFYVWASLTLVVRLRPGMARATAVVLGGIAITALVGLSRVYLGVHYLSDVSGGWALGVAAYALCAAIALVAVQLGQNGRQHAREPRT